MELRKELIERLRRKHHSAYNSILEDNPNHLEEKSTAELNSLATGDDVPQWAPGAPTLRKLFVCTMI